MFIKWRIPKTIQWVFNLFLILLGIFTLFRISTFLAFKPADMGWGDLLPSFLLGIRYDLRWIAVMLLPIVLAGIFPRLTPFFSLRNRRMWTIYLAVVTLMMFFFFGADFGHFAYVSTRLNASALNFMEDAKISFAMLWQSYPMFWIFVGLLVAVAFFAWLYRQTHIRVVEKTDGHGIRYQRKWFLLASFLLAFFVYGRVGWPPLRWSEAFALNDNFKSYLALNPLQNFFTTLRFRKPVYDEKRARELFPVMARQLGLDSAQHFRFDREVFPGSRSLESQPNIVLVICESFSMYKSSMSGNPLNSTPYFNELTKQGVFFERCFSPHFGTARGVFALLTGIPDVQLSKFSSRNPEAIRQHTIINNFEGYEKFYFIGGSSEFNNYKGLLQNVNDLHLYEEGDYKSAPLNVWGISDKNLFLEANSVLKQQSKPFFAIIQTADNHRPFTIPAEDRDFIKRTPPPDSLKKYGFESAEEFHAFCYTDYCYRKFMEAAAKESYFQNTIFVFVGDHGVEGTATAMYPNPWVQQRLSDEHVPFLIYAPALLQPQWHKETVSQIDVLPTIAGLVHQPYQNTTLGRDLLSSKPGRNAAFIIHHDEGKIGIVTDSLYYLTNLRFKKEEMVSIIGNTPWWTPAQGDSMKKELSQLTTAYFEIGRWMLVNNKPK
jgi:phosphoglycerol transferase MdoB-like AlkP superfamily enzyme